MTEIISESEAFRDAGIWKDLLRVDMEYVILNFECQRLWEERSQVKHTTDRNHNYCPEIHAPVASDHRVGHIRHDLLEGLQ